MADIVLAGVGKRYPDGVVAVDRMDLEVADGEFLILVGPSGCGKSTTLNMIAGLEAVTEGEVRIAGEVVNDRPPRERDIAMVFQNYALYPHFTVRENLAFPLEMAKLPPAVIRARVAETAEMLQLTPHLDRKPAKLSGGQRQRVAMGRAIVREPRAFLMDEPLSNLDAKLRVRMRTQISRLQKRLGTTTVYVTHDQAEAMTLGDRVVVMRRGRVQQVGTPSALYERPANLFVAGFIGSPAMNFLAATPRGDRLDTAIGEFVLTDEQRGDLLACGVRGSDLVVGLRPEAIENAALPGRADDPGVTFTAAVDVLESTGSDLYAYFDVGGPPISSVDLDEVAADSERIGDAGHQLVARLRPETAVREGETVELRVASRKLHAFDVATGERVF